MATDRPRMLDLFCGAGGASAGYALAGFDVVGVDLASRPNYPFEFVQADALTFPLGGFDLIHASPPCQEFSAATQPFRSHGRTYPNLVAPIRDRLIRSGTPYVIENVPNAPLLGNPVTLCGTMFGLQVLRHRLFEASFPITQPAHPAHDARCAPMGRKPKAGDWITVVGPQGGGDVDASIGAMGSGWWMTGTELSESIPPAYALFVGRAFLEWVRHELDDHESVTQRCHEFSNEIVTLAHRIAHRTPSQQRHDLSVGIVTRLPNPDDAKQERERKLAAERARRYRERQKGLDVPRLKPGPKPGNKSVARDRRRYEAAELARLRTTVAGYELIDRTSESVESLVE